MHSQADARRSASDDTTRYALEAPVLPAEIQAFLADFEADLFNDHSIVWNESFAELHSIAQSLRNQGASTTDPVLPSRPEAAVASGDAADRVGAAPGVADGQAYGSGSVLRPSDAPPMQKRCVPTARPFTRYRTRGPADSCGVAGDDVAAHEHHHPSPVRLSLLLLCRRRAGRFARSVLDAKNWPVSRRSRRRGACSSRLSVCLTVAGCDGRGLCVSVRACAR